MLKRWALLSLAVATLSSGCSTINLLGEVTRHRAITGDDIDPEKAREIVPGTTTKREIVDRYGQPTGTTTNPDGTEQYTYDYVGVIERTNEKILWAKSSLKDERKRLRVVFAGDAVRGFAYTNSAVPEQNFTREATSSQLYVKTTEGRVAYTNDLNQVGLDVSRGHAATVTLQPDGRLDVGVPADNASPLRMNVRERFGSVNPGTDFTASAAGKQTEVAVKQGRVVVRSRTGCEIVDAGAQKEVSAAGSEGSAGVQEVRFPTIHYGFKSTTPLPTEAPILDCVIDLLGDYPEARIMIEGHSDNVGTPGYNLGLSNRRADGVRRALVASGIDASRLTTTGYGRTKPVASNATDEGRAQNRRVEFKFVASR